MTSYSGPVKRFWWVIVLGVLGGAALGILSGYQVDFATMPPKLTAREQPTYSAGTQLEVTSGIQPYYRTAIDVPVPTATTRPADGEPDTPATPATAEEAPQVNTLIAAANYYPYVIQGDEVKALRERLYGPAPPDSEVTATAIGATITPSRHEPGDLPFIQLIATANSPQGAINLAQQTADAFMRYVKVQQDQRKIRPGQRLVVKQLRKPVKTFAVGGTSLSLPLLIFFALTVVAVLIAFLLDRMFPRSTVIAPARGDEEDFVRGGRADEPLVATSARRDA
jgi:hypothetical protein